MRGHNLIRTILLLTWAVTAKEYRPTLPKHDRFISVEPSLGLTGRHIRLSYHLFPAKPVGWVMPFVYSIDAYHPNRRSNGSSLYAFGLGYSFLRQPMRAGFVPDIGIGMIVGMETIENRYQNIIFGFRTEQSVLYVNRKRWSLIPSLGIFQNVQMNSELYPWDLGAKMGLGVRF